MRSIADQKCCFAVITRAKRKQSKVIKTKLATAIGEPVPPQVAPKELLQPWQHQLQAQAPPPVHSIHSSVRTLVQHTWQAPKANTTALLQFRQRIATHVSRNMPSMDNFSTRDCVVSTPVIGFGRLLHGFFLVGGVVTSRFLGICRLKITRVEYRWQLGLCNESCFAAFDLPHIRQKPMQSPPPLILGFKYKTTAFRGCCISNHFFFPCNHLSLKVLILLAGFLC